MDNFEELKKGWRNEDSTQPNLDKMEVATIIRHRRTKQINRVMQYFWASFVYQLIVYSLCSHVIVRFWNNSEIVIPALTGIAIYIPFTFMLITRFRKLAVRPIVPTLREHIDTQLKLLKRFFHFKKVYEFFLIPVSSLIGLQLCIKIFTGGGILDSPVTSAVLFLVTILSCSYAIKRENDRNFTGPMQELEALRAQCQD